jgi:hypothetical protein
MLLDDDVVAHGQAKASALARRLGRIEWIEHLLLHVRRDAGAVVTNPDLNAPPEVPGRGHKGWLIVSPIADLLGTTAGVRDVNFDWICRGCCRQRRSRPCSNRDDDD